MYHSYVLPALMTDWKNFQKIVLKKSQKRPKMHREFLLIFVFTMLIFFFTGAFGSRGGGRGGGRGGQQRPGKGRGDWQWGPKKGVCKWFI